MSDEKPKLKTMQLMDITDITTECEQLVCEFLKERGVVVTGARSYPQVVSGSRYSVNIYIDTEKFRVVDSTDHELQEQNK
jgi:hypothetical protein